MNFDDAMSILVEYGYFVGRYPTLPEMRELWRVEISYAEKQSALRSKTIEVEKIMDRLDILRLAYALKKTDWEGEHGHDPLCGLEGMYCPLCTGQWQGKILEKVGVV